MLRTRTRPRHVLVTGGAGFLGSHLVERLLQDGDRVTVLDDLSTGDRANLRGVEGHPRLDVIVGDVRTAPDVDVDAIAHLACPASPLHYQRDPMRTLDVLTVGTRRMVDLAASRDARLLIASSSEVYGDPDVHPQPESYRGSVATQGPRACYDEGKRVAETHAWIAAEQFGVDVRVARIFNTYGPRMRPGDGRVVSTFVLQGLRGEPFTVFGDGRQTRSFCYVDDTVEALVRLLNAPRDRDGVHDPVNVGMPHERTLLELVDLVREVTGSTAGVRHLPRPVHDPVRREPDVTRAATLLDWRPTVALEDGLRRTASAFAPLAAHHAPPPPEAAWPIGPLTPDAAPPPPDGSAPTRSTSTPSTSTPSTSTPSAPRGGEGGG
jgi:UDP-glucuronate decarboxylase